MKRWLERFRREDAGLEVVEYAVMAGLIAAVAAGSVGLLGESVAARYDAVAAAIAVGAEGPGQGQGGPPPHAGQPGPPPHAGGPGGPGGGG